MVCLKLGKAILKLSDLTVILRTQLSQSLSSRNIPKVSFSASLQNRTWSELQQAFPAEVKLPFAQPLPPSSFVQLIRFELPVLEVISLKWLALTQVAVLVRMDPVRWLFKIWLFSALFLMASSSSLQMQSLLRRLLSWLQTITMVQLLSVLLVLMCQYCSIMMNPSN